MKTCLHYWLIEPLRKDFADTSGSTPAFEVPINFGNESYNVALFVDNDGLPEYARLEIPRLSKEEIPKELLPLIQAVKEHLLSILRFTYHPEANLFPRPIWTFVEEGTPHKIGLQISQITGKLSFDSDRARRVFIGSFPHREELRLLIDGLDKRIPLQYRYLSLYKILELNFRTQRKWRKKQLEAVLKPYEAVFKQKGFLREPLSHIHEIRDKCAHIKSSKDVIGVTQLNQKEATQVERILPILTEICVAAINTRANGRFEISHFEDFSKQLPTDQT